MASKSIRWPLAAVVVFVTAVCVLLAVGAYLVYHRDRGTPRPVDAAGPSIDVVAAFPGASAEEVERQVTIPLEVAFAGLPNLKSTRTESLFGLASVRLEFERRIDHNQARQEVINRLQFLETLPAGVTPQLSPATAGHEILRYVLRGPRNAQGKNIYTPADLRALQDWILEREFRRVPRIIDVLGAGGAVTRYEVHLDPLRLLRYNISLQQVQHALAEGNANVGGDFVLNVRAVGLFGGGMDPVQQVLGLKDPTEAAARLRAEEKRRLREIRSLVLTNVNAVPVRLEDVVEGGRLADGEEVGHKGVLLGRKPGQGLVGLSLPGEPDEEDVVLGVVYLRPGEEREPALEDVKKKVRELNDTPGRLLPGVRLEPLWERAGGSVEDLLVLQADFPTNAAPQTISEQLRKTRALLLRRAEVRAVLSVAGPHEGGMSPAEAARAEVLVLFHPGKMSNDVANEVQAELSRSLAGIDWDVLPDGMDDFQSSFVAVPGGGLLKISGPDLGELERLAATAQAVLQKLDGVSSVHFRRILGKPSLEFRVDLDKCKRWGVSAADVNHVIRLATGGHAATQMIEGEKTFDITLLWPGERRRDQESILDLPLDVTNNVALPAEPAPRLRLRDLVSPVAADGRPDPKGAFVRPGAAAIWREQGQRMIAVRFAVRGRREADVVAEAENALAPLFTAPYRAEWSVGGR